jgi:hypothetical protein
VLRPPILLPPENTNNSNDYGNSSSNSNGNSHNSNITIATNSKLYQAYRDRPAQLSAARNACLARAADAWRRGDVQLAKRFTREGHELNAKMRAEGREGARGVVRAWVEGMREELEGAGASASAGEGKKVGSDGDGDAWARGEVVGGGLGVCLGRALGGEAEAYLDLRGLFADEGVELLDEYLMVLERDGFTGLGECAGRFIMVCGWEADLAS